LGGGKGTPSCTYDSVSFANADLRRIIPSKACFLSCNFAKARIEKIEFDGTRLTNCVFDGKVEDVRFYGELPDAELLRNVDFKNAMFSGVEFRRLSIQSGDVIWPGDRDIYVVTRYTDVLDQSLDILEGDSSETARYLKVIFAHCRKWASPRQYYGYINRRDFHVFPERNRTMSMLDIVIRRAVSLANAELFVAGQRVALTPT
jgi:hypothetical protein